jgi:dienelactone hydrolase
LTIALGEIESSSTSESRRDETGAGMKVWAGFVAFGAILAIILSVREISRASHGLSETAIRVGSIPVTVFRPVDAPPSPAVVIAHGFAGSQQLMQPMAMTLARNGYIAVTFDFAGHGRNAEPLAGGIADMEKSTNALLAEIGTVVAFARALPGSDNRLAVVGHSMASDLVVEYSMKDPQIEATAALSLFGRDVTATNPKNLIVIDGAWETSMLTDAGFRIVGMAAEGPARERVTYGDVARGDGRRFVLAADAEHIGVLYSRDALSETVGWMNETFGRHEAGFVDRRGKWLALLFLGLVALAFPASRLLPVVSATPLGAGLSWRRLAPVAIAPAILTPLVLWKIPTDFLPILLGDYLVVHFLVYGLSTVAGLWLFGGLGQAPVGVAPSRVGLAIGGLALAGYYVIAMGLPIDAYVTSFVPTGLRWPLIPAMFCGTAIYFLADEWLTRGAGAAWGGYAFTKLCFLVSLIAAVALNPRKLFFLVIIVPVIFLLFVIYGLLSRWVYSRTRDPRVGALGSAIGLAWAIAVTFPVVG